MRTIIFLDKNEIDEQDPLFINKFDKHIITFQYLLDKNKVRISNQIVQIIKDLTDKGELKIKNWFKRC